VVIGAEDPGAANWIIPLLPALDRAGWTAEVLADGAAHKILTHAGIRVERPDRGKPATAVSPETDILLVGTSSSPDTMVLPMLAMGRKLGVCTIATVDFPPLYTRAQRVESARDRFRGRQTDVLAFTPDWLVLPDTLSSDVFVELGFPEDRVCVFGNPYFDRVRAERERVEREGRDLAQQRLFPDKGNRPVLVFATEGAGTSVALDAFLETVEDLAVEVVKILRLHPKDTPDDYHRYLARIDEVSREGGVHDLLYAADLTIGLKSMLLAESAILGTPALSMAAWQSEPEDIPNFAGIHIPSLDDFGDVLDRLVAEPGRVPVEAVSCSIPTGSVDELLNLMQSVV